MFAELMAGNEVTPESGWFRKGIAQTRFDWKAVGDRYDRNRDGEVTRDEYPGTAADFDRLDRDLDGTLTALDIDLTARDPLASRLGDQFSLQAFRFTDRSANGKADPTEVDFLLRSGTRVTSPYGRFLKSVIRPLESRWRRAAREGVGFLTFADFQEAFDLSALRRTLPGSPYGVSRPVPVKQEVLLRAFFRREMGNWCPGPPVNAPAPDFTLGTPDGGPQVTLSRLYPTRPVVLIFGNVTCGELRNHVGSLEELLRRYNERAHFLLVYTRETHPAGGWEVDEDRLGRVDIAQPRDREARVSAARTCRRVTGLDIPVLVDDLNDRVCTLYSGMPLRLYVIDRQGKIAYKSGRGPYSFKPAEAERALILLLQSERSPGDGAGRAPH
jgi:hypothetical protein